MATQTLLPQLDKVRGMRVRAVTLAVAALPIVILLAVLAREPRALVQPTDPTELWTAIQAVASTLLLCATIGVGAIAWY